ANLPTTFPLQLQLLGVVAVSLVGIILLGALVGLAIGSVPPRIASLGRLDDRSAVLLAIAAGCVGAAFATAAAAVRAPVWSRAPSLDPLGAYVPLVTSAIQPISAFMTRLAVVTATLATINRVTAAWTRRRLAAALALAVIGFIAAGMPAGSHLGSWAIG